MIVTVVAGVAASFAMDAVQNLLARTLERARSSDDRDEEVEAIEAVVRLIGTIAPSLATRQRERTSARALHYGFGIAFGFAYVAAVRRVPALASGSGAAFGAGLFLVSDRILIPTLKLGRSWDRYSRAERLNAFASHLAYGIVLETIRARAANADRR